MSSSRHGSRVLGEALFSLENLAEGGDHELLPVGFRYTHLAAGSWGVSGAHMGEWSGDCRALLTCELGDENSQ